MDEWFWDVLGALPWCHITSPLQKSSLSKWALLYSYSSKSLAAHNDKVIGENNLSNGKWWSKPNTTRRWHVSSCAAEKCQLWLLDPGVSLCFFATRPEVLLASDPNCDRAATALCVGVGRLHEPKEWGKTVAAKVDIWMKQGVATIHTIHIHTKSSRLNINISMHHHLFRLKQARFIRYLYFSSVTTFLSRTCPAGSSVAEGHARPGAFLWAHALLRHRGGRLPDTSESHPSLFIWLEDVLYRSFFFQKKKLGLAKHAQFLEWVRNFNLGKTKRQNVIHFDKAVVSVASVESISFTTKLAWFWNANVSTKRFWITK